MMRVDNLEFEDGLWVHVERAAFDNLFYPVAWCCPRNPARLPYVYGIPRSMIRKVERCGEYNTHYFHTIKAMIKKVEEVSKKKLVRIERWKG